MVSIRRNDGKIIFNPSGEARIDRGDILIAIGHADSLRQLTALAHGRTPANVDTERKVHT